MDTLKTTIHDIDELIPDPDNVREHPSENHQALVRSVKRFGIRKPIVAHEGSKVVYAGNETLKVALELGIKEIPVSWIPADVSETVCRAYAIADNRTNDLNLFDDDGLADLLKVLNADEGIELEDVGFTLDDLDELVGKDIEVEDDGFSGDESDEILKKWGVELGQSWSIGNHIVCCDDSYTSKSIEKYDYGCVICDPPYDDANYEGIARLLSLADSVSLCMGADEQLANIIRLSPLRVDRFFVLDLGFSQPRGNDAYVSHLLVGRFRNGGFTPKNLHDGFSSIIRTKYRGNLERAEGRELYHAHEKSVETIGTLLRHHTDKKMVVLDPFIGSGTTIIACEQLELRCIGFEIRKETVALCLERAEQFGLSPRLDTVATTF